MKNKKLMGLATMVLALGALVGCGDKGCKHENYVYKSDDNQHWEVCEKCGEEKEGSRKNHSFKNNADKASENKEATCTEGGFTWQKCACGVEKKKDVDPKGHSYTELVSTTATCTAAGKNTMKCSRCTATQEVDAEALGHDFQDVAEAAGNKAPTCTVVGNQVQKCSRCTETRDVEVAALGHAWEDVAEDAGNKAPTCTVAGNQVQKCTREGCTEKQNVEVAALGHHVVCDDDGSQPAEGKAKVRLYKCDHEGCDVTYFGFKATEVSPNAGRLVFEPAEGGEGVEQGARFWGRPIGNKMELDDNGSATARPDDLSAVYDPTVSGDLFEYVFDLTEEQVKKIGETALLYCDAKPADYLNGQDFWSCDPSAEEWTPGLYIEGEKAGQPIEDYRYILYVDDKPVDFDPEMKAPVASGSGQSGATNLPRAEYVLPYVFKLHTGTNKISLRMAGGYRSLFYNFTFRSAEVEEPEPPTPPAPTEYKSLVSFPSINCTTATAGVVAASNGETKGIMFSTVYNVGTAGNAGNNWTQTPPQAETDASEGDKVVYTVNSDKAVTGAKLVMTINYKANSWDPANLASLSMISNDGTKGYVWKDGAWEASPVRYKLFVNGTEVVIDPTIEGYTEPAMGKNTDVPVELPCSFNLKAGDNKIELQNYGGYGAIIVGFEVKGADTCDAKLTSAPHIHSFNSEGKCYCGAQGVAINALTGAVSTPNNKSGTPAGFLKLGSNGNDATYKFNATAGTAHLVIVAAMDNWKTGAKNDGRAPFSGGSSGADDFEMSVNGTKIDFSALKTGKYSNILPDANPIASGHSGAAMIDLGEVTLVEGENTLYIKRLASYNVLISNFFIVL